MAARELIAPSELAALDAAIERAFATGDDSGLEVLGYGEISSVIAWPGIHGRVACKRLPVFPDSNRYQAYAACLDDYLERLRQVGIDVVETRLCRVDGASGQVVGYCVQPVLDAERLGPKVLARVTQDEAMAFFDAVLDHVLASVSPTLGLDSQLSNWALAREPDQDSASARPALVYLDVSTPLMRDAQGTDALDKDLFLSSLPWALRGLVKRLMLGSILATYFSPRRVIVDFLANLYKEKLDHLVAPFIARANQRGDQPGVDAADVAAAGAWAAITEPEVARYYRSDARTWALLQRLRRMDRAWQHKVRRRAYPFLLPGPIDR